MVTKPYELIEAEMYLKLYRIWGLRPHELNQTDGEILRVTRILEIAGAFGGE